MPPKSLDIGAFSIGGAGDINPNNPPGGVVVLAKGHFLSDLQAGHGLYSAIDQLVGTINFAHRKWRSEGRSGKVRPKAKIFMGDHQYLFRENQNLNEDRYWYNSDFSLENWEDANFTDKDLAKLLPYVRLLIQRIRKSPSASRVVTAMTIMADGQISNNPSQRILKTWTALEALFSRSENQADRYPDIVRRAIFPFKDKELWALRMSHAVRARNRYVHDGRQSISPEAVSDGLDMIFCTMVDWILAHSTLARSHQELLEIIDLSHNKDALQKQIRHRREALSILDR